MSKRKNPHTSPLISKRYKETLPHPFGFDLTPIIATICHKSTLGNVSHQISNYITYFNKLNEPVFKKPHKVWKVEEISGIYTRLKGQTNRIFISGMHNRHTVSLYNIAHIIRDELRKNSLVLFKKEPTTRFKHINISKAVEKKNKNKSIMWLNAYHKGTQVVLKTTTSVSLQLSYILEAIIHHLAASRINRQGRKYIPPIHFIGFGPENRLIVCSEQLQIPSVTDFLYGLKKKTILSNPNVSIFCMVRSVCLAIRRLQISSQFTHRDCHISNVYYDYRYNKIQFIDFDWSAIRWQDKIISVPRHLYDTTRQGYGYNKSVDCCVFLRTLGPTLKIAQGFKKYIYDPLMERYEKESEIFLKQRSEHDNAAMQIYRLSTKEGKLRGEYKHKYGIGKYKNRFDYHMGYYTWECMTPEAILKFLDENKFF